MNYLIIIPYSSVFYQSVMLFLVVLNFQAYRDTSVSVSV